MRNTLVTWAKQLLAQLPSECAICHAWPAQRLCQDCVLRFTPQQPRCHSCARLLPGTATQCGACQRYPPPLRHCLAAVDYGYPWNQIIGQFKFHADPSWVHSLAALLRQTAGVGQLLAEVDWVLPIPLSATRLQQRGYNQALLLARACSATKLQQRWLLRLRDTTAQSQLPRAQRLRNLQGAFVVEPSLIGQVAGQRILLIDDVMTTGATLHSAAQPLLAAGASSVSALVLARTPG